MELTTWKPFADMDSVLSRFGSPRRFFDNSEFEWQPAADISETDKEYLIKADLPEVRRKDINVSVDNGIISLTGERKQKKEHKDEKFLRTESYFGAFTRRFTLPVDVDPTKISATNKDGVLTVHLPKSQVANTKSIDVKIS